MLWQAVLSEAVTDRARTINGSRLDRPHVRRSAHALSRGPGIKRLLCFGDPADYH